MKNLITPICGMTGILSVLLFLASSLQAGLIGHYPLDTITSGTTTPDTTAINGDGALNGSVALSPGAGKIGGAFSFGAGNANYVGIQDAGFGQTAFTASVWFQPTSIDAGDPLANWTNANPSPRTFLIRTNSGALQTYVRENGSAQIGGSNAFPTQSLTTTDFNHAVLTYDGQTLRTYLNGEKSNNDRNFPSARPIGQGVQGTAAIGGRGGSEGNMDGLVDEVSFWNEDLAPGEVAGLFNLADDNVLNYDAGQFDLLKQVHDAGSGATTIGLYTWSFAGALTGTDGQLINNGPGRYTLVLDAQAGTGLSAVVPEPTTLLIWSLLAGLGVGLGWRRRK